MLSHFFNKEQPQQTNLAQMGQNIPYGLFENDPNAVKEFLLRQHDRLAPEQVSRITHRDNLKLVISGAIVGIFAFVLQYPLIALAYPIIAMFIAADWEAYDQRIHHIAQFFKWMEAVFLGDKKKVLGWEHWRREVFPRFQWGVLFSAKGFFLSTQIVFAIYGIAKTWSMMAHLGAIDKLLVVVMMIAAVISIVFTIYVVQHARDKVIPTDKGQQNSLSQPN